MSDALVDVFCNDLEVGRSLVLKEVGPTCAYLEHAAPLPVGAELRVQADNGSELGAVVVRVHEVSTDASRLVGMFVRVVSLEGEAASWWKSNISQDSDPMFPEKPTASLMPSRTARTNTVDVSDDEMKKMAASDRDEAGVHPAEPAEPAVSPKDLAADSAAASPDDLKSTLKMSADQLKGITDQAKPDGKNGVSNGKPSGKKKRRRRKKKE